MSDPSAAPAGGGAGSWFDPEVVARDAMSKDPGLPSGLALRLAREAGEMLADEPDMDAPDLARRLLVANRETGATPANCVATAAVLHRHEAGPHGA
ncbi:MAG TPA: hypothetical protein VLR26_07425 [Frankiaceae bacterium]|nr:hypothetical protein [Frankiaceae bacterium]